MFKNTTNLQFCLIFYEMFQDFNNLFVLKLHFFLSETENILNDNKVLNELTYME